MRIVDLTAGDRAIWFNKDNPLTVFLDIRESVEPTFVMDATKTCLADNHFDLVVFDPPHVNFGKNSNMAKNYGHHTTQQIRDFVTGAAKEAHRISTPKALMAFKWNDHDQKIEDILLLMADYWEPLFGHVVSARKVTRGNSTYWVMLRRKP